MRLTAQEQATLNFYQWESLGRGYYHFDTPVEIEPPYEPFVHFSDINIDYVDDGRSAGVIERIGNIFIKKEVIQQITIPEFLPRSNPITEIPSLIAFALTFPKGQEISAIITSELLNMLSLTQYPLSFEILGTADDITIQLVCSEQDNFHAESHLKAYFPSVIIKTRDVDDLGFDENSLVAICDFGLKDEFMLPINMTESLTIDSLTSIIATFDMLTDNDVALFQVMFKGLQTPLAKDICYSVSDGVGGSFFVDSPDMVSYAREKVASPLFSVVMRLSAQGHSDKRSEYLITEFVRSVTNVSRTKRNSLIPLSNEGYAYDFHLHNIYRRMSNRLGFILNTKELTTFVHYPNKTVVSAKLGLSGGKTKMVSEVAIGQKYVLGINEHNGTETTVTVDDEARLRHAHLIGATGVGKSTLIANMIFDDIEHGNGCALFDPHGDICEDILARIPEKRKQDVLIIDPSDSEFPIGFNLLGAHSEAEKIVLSSDLVSAFKRHATAWGDNMTAVLSNAINTFLESTHGGTLIELKRFLLEEKFRKRFLESVEDNAIHYYWEYEYPMVKKAIAPLLTRIDTFLRPKIIRYMLAQKSGIDFKACIEEKKIILIKLSQGLIGEDNSYLLGSLFLSKFNQVAQSRQALVKHERHPYYIYLDEFQNFITPSIASILSGARKYGLGLILAHQELAQIDDNKTLNSVISNPYIRICFRLGDNDAKKLEDGFSFFEAPDLQNLGIGQAIIRVGSANSDCNVQTFMMPEIDESTSHTIRDFIIKNTRTNIAKPKAKIQEILDSLLPNFTRKAKQEKVPNEETKQIEIVQPNNQEESKVGSKEEIIDTVKVDDIQQEKEEYLQRIRERENIKLHRSLQSYTKTIAIQRGFVTHIEEETNDGKRIDVGLTKDGIRIAIEISVTNTTKYEVQNIQKCLDNDYNLVYIMSEDEKHLKNIEKKAKEIIDKKHVSRLFFFNPKELSTYLEAVSSKKEKTNKRVNGWRVNVNYQDDDSIRKKEHSIANKVINALRKKK